VQKKSKSKIPSIVHHKARNADVVFLRDAVGKRRQIYLGPHGSEQARQRYHEIIAAHLAGERPEPRSQRSGKQEAPSAYPTVTQLCAEFTVWAEREYLDGSTGKVSREVVNFDHAIDHLVERHGDLHTDQFTIRDLQAVREAMVDSGRLCRNTVNARTRRIKSVFRWGTEQGFVPGRVWHELSALRGLRVGHGGVRDLDPVEAVSREDVDAVLPFLPGPLKACVELQWATGMRPSEALQIKMTDLDRSGDVWLYTVRQHKNRWRNQQRVVALGPAAQDVLRPLLRLDGGYLFSPRDGMAQVQSERRAKRKTPMTPTQRTRAQRNAKKPPSVGDHYGIDAYRKAIHRACDRAGIPRWSPHRLRHAKGTELARTEGIEVARIALGHKDDRVTRRYAASAEQDLAISVARKHG
jgi:integrase